MPDQVATVLPLLLDALQLFAPLVAGGRLVIARPGGHAVPDYVAELMSDSHVSLFQTGAGCHVGGSLVRGMPEHACTVMANRWIHVLNY